MYIFMLVVFWYGTGVRDFSYTPRRIASPSIEREAPPTRVPPARFGRYTR